MGSVSGKARMASVDSETLHDLVASDLYIHTPARLVRLDRIPVEASVWSRGEENMQTLRLCAEHRCPLVSRVVDVGQIDRRGTLDHRGCWNA